MNIFKSSNSSQKRSGLSAKSLVSLLGDGELDSLALGKGDVRLVALADDEHVVDPSGEGVAVGVLNVDDVERSRVSLSRHDGSHSASVPPSSHHAQVAGIKLDSVLDLAGGDVYLDRVVDLNIERLFKSRLDTIIQSVKVDCCCHYDQVANTLRSS